MKPSPYEIVSTDDQFDWRNRAICHVQFFVFPWISPALCKCQAVAVQVRHYDGKCGVRLFLSKGVIPNVRYVTERL